MPEQQIDASAWRATCVGAAAAVLAIAVVLAPSGVVGTSGAALSALAYAVLALAIGVLVARSVLLASVRAGARATATRQRTLAVLGAGALLTYAALIIGALGIEAGGAAACPTWPLCAPQNDAAALALAHRGVAFGGSLLALVAVVLVLRGRAEPLLRRVAWWVLALVLASNAVGALVALAGLGGALPVVATRVLHFATGGGAWAALITLAALLWRLPATARVAAASPAAGASDTVLLSGKPSLLKDYVSLTKPGVITLLIFTTITSMYITPAGSPALGLVLWTAVGGWLMAAGSHAFNCYFDRDLDVNMGRTARRPIPSGRIPAWHALVLGGTLATLAFGILAIYVNLLTAALAFAGLLYYVVIYTLWLKRTSQSNIVIGGGAGAFPPLVGWAAVTGSVAPAALLLWLIVFYWTPPHFWALALIRQKDYARAGVPMLPVVTDDPHTMRQIVLYTVMLLMVSILPFAVGMLGAPYLVAALVLGGLLLHLALTLQRTGTIPDSWALYKYSLLYLFLLFAAMVGDRALMAG